MTDREKIIEILETVALNRGSSCRAGRNGLRNADEIADLIVEALKAMNATQGADK